MKILLWATTLQADILALAFRLDESPRCELLIVAEHSASFLASLVSRRRPLKARVLDREDPDVQSSVERLRPDVVVCDNHFPPFNAAPRVCAMWHGLGWKARPAAEISVFHKHIQRLTGVDPRTPNPRFLAQCYHERDRQWRIREWGLHPDSCSVTGSCFADLLRGPPPYSRGELEGEYNLDLSRKTVLVNVTWHYGRIFPGSWRPRWLGSSDFEADLTSLREIFARIHDHGANVLFCLHDRKRYEKAYLVALHELARAFGERVSLRHKDEHPDNWADLSVADVMLSNLSSFTTFFYHSRRPVIHLCPPADAATLRAARYSSSGLSSARRSSPLIWMNDPRDNGGISVEDLAQTLAALDTALREPECCRERSERWLAEHVAFPPESAAARLEAALESLSKAR